MKKDYMPKASAAFIEWLTTLLTKLATLGAGVGITPTEITAINTQGGVVQTARATAASKTLEAKAATDDFTAQRKAFSDLFRPIAQRSKNTSGYTTAIGTELGIEGPEHNPDLANAKPTGDVSALPGGQVKVDFKLGDAERVNIYSVRSSTPAPNPDPEPNIPWVFLATDTHPPYIDTRPNLTANPELRLYKLVYVDNYLEVGIESDFMQIKV